MRRRIRARRRCKSQPVGAGISGDGGNGLREVRNRVWGCDTSIYSHGGRIGRPASHSAITTGGERLLILGQPGIGWTKSEEARLRFKKKKN